MDKIENIKKLPVRSLEDKIWDGDFPGKNIEASDDTLILSFIRQWIEEVYGSNDLAKPLASKMLEAVDDGNQDELHKLAGRIENHINYCDQKIRGEKGGFDYMSKLRKCVEFLRKKHEL